MFRPEKAERDVAQAATDAAKEEAEAQGLTFNRDRNSSETDATRAESNAGENGRRPDVAEGGQTEENRPAEMGTPLGVASGDPSIARPVL